MLACNFDCRAEIDQAIEEGQAIAEDQLLRVGKGRVLFTQDPDLLCLHASGRTKAPASP